MTLKENFWHHCDDEYTDKWVNAEHCEQIADEFAIGFIEFTEGAYSFGNIVGKWYLHANTSKEYTTKELLEIYKKEKGL